MSALVFRRHHARNRVVRGERHAMVDQIHDAFVSAEQRDQEQAQRDAAFVAAEVSVTSEEPLLAVSNIELSAPEAVPEPAVAPAPAKAAAGKRLVKA